MSSPLIILVLLITFRLHVIFSVRTDSPVECLNSISLQYVSFGNVFSTCNLIEACFRSTDFTLKLLSLKKRKKKIKIKLNKMEYNAPVTALVEKTEYNLNIDLLFLNKYYKY